VDTGGSYPWLKQPGREADYSPPSNNTDVKNAWSYASTPPLRLHGVVLRNKVLILPLPLNAKQKVLIVNYVVIQWGGILLFLLCFLSTLLL
jgi:hypothetical protein